MPSRVNVRWLLTVLIVLGLIAAAMPFLDPPAPEVPPTLVGLADAEGPLTELRHSAPSGEVTTMRPGVWPPEGGPAEPLAIVPFRPAAGVVVGDDASREAAASLMVRTVHVRLGPFVHRTVAGLPAIELAYGDRADVWSGVSTYVFGPDLIIAVDCRLPGGDPEPVLTGCATAVNHLAAA